MDDSRTAPVAVPLVDRERRFGVADAVVGVATGEDAQLPEPLEQASTLEVVVAPPIVGQDRDRALEVAGGFFVREPAERSLTGAHRPCHCGRGISRGAGLPLV